MVCKLKEAENHCPRDFPALSHEHSPRATEEGRQGGLTWAGNSCCVQGDEVHEHLSPGTGEEEPAGKDDSTLLGCLHSATASWLSPLRFC